jgi:hypothetical protein
VLDPARNDCVIFLRSVLERRLEQHVDQCGILVSGWIDVELLERLHRGERGEANS